MELKGIIKEITNWQEGVGESTGREWQRLELVVVTASGVSETTGKEWERVVKFDCMNDVAKAVRQFRSVGDAVTVTFDIRARYYERNGKWYNDLNPTSVQAINAEPKEPVLAAPYESMQKNESQNPAAEQTDMFGNPIPDGKDALPF